MWNLWTKATKYSKLPSEVIDPRSRLDDLTRWQLDNAVTAFGIIMENALQETVEVGSGVEGIQSQVVLYYGSFAALAGSGDGLDWRHEAWETLTHELLHHLEWRAQAPDLEEFDWAVEHNFARQERDAFDPTFFLSGERRADGVYWVEDDVFLDHIVRSIPASVAFIWQGRSYLVQVPADATLPCFLTVEGVADPPSGDLVLVLRRAPGVRDLFTHSPVFQADVRVPR